MEFFTIVVIVIALSIFILTFAVMFSSNTRSKFMGHQIKIMKNVIDENEDVLKEMSTKSANISKDAIEIKAKAIKDGLTDSIYCKHCGAKIDSDSKFCKKCGRKI